ncbi:MAG: hypothetical protein U0936_12085 [Planctomycetaceae bacterium]
MFGDGLSKRGALLEQSFAYETDRRLIEAAREKSARQTELEAIREATHISDQQLLLELVDCGVRADSLHVLMLFPLVHVAWSNGHIERAERLAILEAAAQDGIRADSPGYEVLKGWLTHRPDAQLIKTWKDYVAAIRMFVSPEMFNSLQVVTVVRAWRVAESAGGLLGFQKVSQAERAAIKELNLAFS